MTIVAGSLVRTVSDTYSGEHKMPMRASPTDAQAAFYVRPGADALVVSGRSASDHTRHGRALVRLTCTCFCAAGCWDGRLCRGSTTCCCYRVSDGSGSATEA